MSNLIKALKRAEQDREAAKQARFQAEQGADSPVATSPTPSAEPETARPAVIRSQRDAVRPSERVTPTANSPRAPTKPYRSVGIALVVAALFAVGLGVSLRNREADKSPVPLTIATEVTKATGAAAPLPAVAPGTLLTSDGGPLQLRLDRSVEAVGEIAHRRNQLQ